MKNGLFILLLTLFSKQAFTQNKISGRFTDEHNHPVEYLEVTASKSDSILSGTLTDRTGAFILNLPSGKYRIKAALFGKALYEKAIRVSRSTDLGTIRVHADLQMKEVAVTGEKRLIERKVDRLVFHVDKSLSASGGSAIDALKATPSLRVENGVIQLIGRSKLAIMINGRLLQLSGSDLTHFLQSIRSEDIQSIEVISDPPARYDAEGDSGLVNIKLKTTGPDDWNAFLNSSYEQTTYPTGSASGSFNYKRSKLSLYSNLSYTDGSEMSADDETTQYTRQTWHSYYKDRDYVQALSGRLGFDYNLSKKWTMGMDYAGNLGRPHTYGSGNDSIKNKQTLLVDSLINTTSSDHAKIYSNGLNLHAVAQLDSAGGTLSTDVDYFGYGRTIDRNFHTQHFYADKSPMPKGYSSANSKGSRDLELYSAKVDVSKSSAWAQLSYGGKLHFSHTRYDNRYFNTTKGTAVEDKKQSNAFDYVEKIQALYLSAKRSITDHWKVKLGLRMENTQTRGKSITLNETHKNSYMEFFPTAYVLYKPSDRHSFSLHYDRRLSRPKFSHLNPFKVYKTPYHYRQGNPTLRPSFANRVKLQYAFRHSLFTSLSYTHTTQGMGNPPVFDESTGISYLKVLNYFKSDHYNVYAAYIFNPINGLESTCQVSVHHTEMQVTEPELKLKDVQAWGAYFSIVNRFSLNRTKTIKGAVNFWYDTPQLDGVYDKKARESLSLGLRFSLLKRRLNLSLYAHDILNTEPYEERLTSGNTIYSFIEYNDTRMFRLSLTYHFGSRDLKVKKRTTGNEVERRRAK